MNVKLNLLFSALIFCGHCVSADHVVFLLTCASYSHRVGIWPIALRLQEKGHKVTIISPWGSKDHFQHPNITEIVPNELKVLMNSVLEDNFDVNYRAYGLVPPLYLTIDYFCYISCESMYKSEAIKQWLGSDPKVDLIVGDIMVDCAYGMAQKLSAKTALYQSIPMLTKYFEAFGIDGERSSVPDYDIAQRAPLTFLNRFTNALLSLWYRALDIIFHEKYKTLFLQELGISDIPDVYEIRDRTSLIIMNGDYISEYPRSLPPFVVKVEGIHIKTPEEIKPLSQEMEYFINGDSKGDNKTEGFMFISFGTVAKAPHLPIAIKDSFFNSLKSFPHMRFIWKWDGEKPESYPDNIMFVKWVDQQDVLAHPKIKGFLTQAGRPSTQEALYNGVPTITFPVFSDQDFNAHRAEELGVSICLDFVGITEEKITGAISQLLTDDSYKKKTQQLSALAKDVPMRPVDTAVWWIEFALRHTEEELLLLKPMARHLTWFQKRDLDVWLFAFVLVGIFCALSFYVIKRIVSRCSFQEKNNGKVKTS